MNKEIIVCAAIHFKDGKQYEYGLAPVNIENGYVISGIRHGHILQQHTIVLGRENRGYIEHPTQGFMTNLNRFVDRIEGAAIHIANGGILNYGKQLYSEDLY